MTRRRLLAAKGLGGADTEFPFPPGRPEGRRRRRRRLLGRPRPNSAVPTPSFCSCQLVPSGQTPSVASWARTLTVPTLLFPPSARTSVHRRACPCSTAPRAPQPQPQSGSAVRSAPPGAGPGPCPPHSAAGDSDRRACGGLA